MIRASTLEKITLFAMDFIGLSLCFYLAYWLQFHTGWIVEKYDLSKSFAEYYHAGIVVNLGWMLLFALVGLYRKWLLESRTTQVLVLGQAVVYGMILVFAALFGMSFLEKIFSPEATTQNYVYQDRIKLILLYGVLVLVVVAGGRMLVYSFLRQLLRKGYGVDKVLVLGANEMGRDVVAKLQKCPELGQKVVGFVDEGFSTLQDKVFANIPVLGKYADLPKLIKEHGARSIIIAHESSSIKEVLRVLDRVAEIHLHIYIIPDLYGVVSGHFKGNIVHGVELQELFAYNMAPWQVRTKRIMDVFIAGALLLLTAPIMLLTMILIKIDSKGPIFYSQERVGLYGRKFMVHKFRTMRIDAEADGPQWASKNDPRITRIGRFLRKTRIDELPQLWCVLQGDMSMVGPRPEREHFINTLRTQIPLYMFRLKMKPGLTGWAQVRHSYDSSIEDVQKKLQYDLYYFENMSLLLDFQILVRTIWVVLTGKGAQ